MRFLLRIASRSARLRAAGQRARRGLSRDIDANGAGLLRQTRADRGDARWCAAPTPSSSPRPTRRRRACRSRVCCVRRAIRPRARNRRRRRAAFLKRGAVWFSRARDDVTRSQRGERKELCIVQVPLLLRWDSKRRLGISPEISVLDSRSVAIADADPTGVSARQARRLEAGKTIFVVAYFASLKLAQYNKPDEFILRALVRLRCALVISYFKLLSCHSFYAAASTRSPSTLLSEPATLVLVARPNCL